MPTASQKMGFGAVLAFVIGSQVGSGIFLLPHTLSPYGGLGLASFLFSGGGAMLLALIFARFCMKYPETGGPHVYITHAFGKIPGFFVAWSYWVLAWFSSAPLLGTIAGAFCALLDVPCSWQLVLFVQIFALGALTWINLRGVQSSGLWEMFMTCLKVICFVLFPLCALFFINWGHFTPFNPGTIPPMTALSAASFATLWGFIGIEAVTAPAGSVRNPQKTIPRALILGTLIVIVLYATNSFAVMGVVSPQELSTCVLPYTRAFEVLFGPLGKRFVAALTIIACAGAMNAWLLTAGQVAKGAAQSGLFPKVFERENTRGAPHWGVGVSAFLLGGCVLLLSQQEIARQILFVIEVSVVGYLGIYFFCALAWLKLSKKMEQASTVSTWALGVASALFCGWALWGSGLETILWALLLPLSGLPFLLLWRKSRSPQPNFSF
jgi:APA family basic amino acid/polyamine antiporter